VAVPRTNQPYSFTRKEARLGADYRLSGTTKLGAGVDHDRHERSLQEVNETKETTAWGKLTVRAKDFMDMTFRVARAERNASNYRTVPEIDPPQNPLLRKYNMADRTRTSGGITASATPNERITVGVSLDFASDDYSRSTLGLIDASDISLNADASAMLTEKTSVHLFAGHERIKSKQAGSQSFSTPDWFAENDDKVNTAGVGIGYQLIENRLDVGADYVISRSSGEIHFSGVAPPDFPDLKTDLDSVKLYANYRLKDNMSLHAAYWYESYDTSDWMLDDVDPDTVSNVLGFGEDSPSYDVSVVSLSLRYKF
jgi:MtrB/PioB family decaheme-associated outer membrane protein